MVAQRAETPPPPGTLVSGIIPPLADPYFQRPETGPGLASDLFPGQAVVLTHGAETEAAPAAQGGTGKTQLAAEFARGLWSARAVDVLVWVTASTREAVIAGYAQAAGAVGASDPDADALAAAGRLVAWLARTERRWALVLDDLADPADLEGLWPSGRGGRVVITTRLPGGAFSGGPGHRGACGGRWPADRAGRRVQPPGSAVLPRRRARGLYRSADRGARPRRGPRRPAHRPGPGGRGDQREPAELPGIPHAAQRAARPHVRPARRRGIPGRPGHLVAGGRVRGPARARGSGLAGPGPGRRTRSGRDPRGRADQPGRVRLHRRPAERRHGHGPDHGPGRHHQPGPGRPGQHRPRQPGPYRAGPPRRADRGARLPATR